jgi:hypothetical protein
MIRRLDIIVMGGLAVIVFWILLVSSWPRHDGLSAVHLELAMSQTLRVFGILAAILGIVLLFRVADEEPVRRILVAMIVLSGALLIINPDWPHVLAFAFLGLVIAGHDVFGSRRDRQA